MGRGGSTDAPTDTIQQNTQGTLIVLSYVSRGGAPFSCVFPNIFYSDRLATHSQSSTSIQHCPITQNGEVCASFTVVNVAVGNSQRLPKKVWEISRTIPEMCWCRAFRAQGSLSRGATNDAGETHLPHSADDKGQVGAGSHKSPSPKVPTWLESRSGGSSVPEAGGFLFVARAALRHIENAV